MMKEVSLIDWRFLCLPLILLLLVLIFVVYFASKDELIMDAEPENTSSKPNFVEGAGTEEKPFVLAAAKSVKPGETIRSQELISISKITPGLNVQLVDYPNQNSQSKFSMLNSKNESQGVRMIQADDEGVIQFRIMFDDSIEPSLTGEEYNGLVKVGKDSVYFSWNVVVKPETKSVKQSENPEAAKNAKKQEELARVKSRAKTIDFSTLGVASVDDRDDLQTIKGVGPFIEEKLNALGIYTFEQVGNMTPKIEEEVNKAIEFFPGSVKRDEWAKQGENFTKTKNETIFLL